MGWTTPPSSWWWWWRSSCCRCWWWTRRRGVEPSGGDSDGVSPLRSSPAAAFWLSVSWFCVSPPPPFAKRQGTFFIGVFRSRRSRWRKDRWQWSVEAHYRGSHAARYRGRVGPPLLALGAPLVRFLRPQVLFLPKNDARKFAGHLDVVWVPETLKERNRVFCLRRVNSIKYEINKMFQNHYITVI